MHKSIRLHVSKQSKDILGWWRLKVFEQCLDTHKYYLEYSGRTHSIFLYISPDYVHTVRVYAWKY
jgi:hypothetical protein